MFSKTNKPLDPNAPATPSHGPGQGFQQPAPAPLAPTPSPAPTSRSGRAAPSIISADFVIRGDLETRGDMQIEGTVQGDIRSNLLTIGQSALVEGEIFANDITVNGHVKGRIRAQKVRLSASARVEGDIMHKNIAIESGASFEGSVKRADDPLTAPAPPLRPAIAAAPVAAIGQDTAPKTGAA